MHLAAAALAKPEPVALARQLFEREMSDGYGIFDGAAAAYAELLGETGLAEYRRLATERWDALPQRVASRDRDPETEADYWRLEPVIEFFAVRDGNIDARIALRAKDLSSPARFFALASFCREQGRTAEALRRAQEGLWMFEDDRPDERLVELTADLLLELGRQPEAEAVLCKTFDRSPSFNGYRALTNLVGKPARARAIEQLERLALAMARPRGAANLLVKILMQERQFVAAWAAVDRFGADESLTRELARVSEAACPERAIGIYTGEAEYLIRIGGRASYQTALKLILRMAKLRPSGEQAAYVADLRARFKAKRTFVALLA
jgi:hypothetical protein